MPGDALPAPRPRLPWRPSLIGAGVVAAALAGGFLVGRAGAFAPATSPTADAPAVPAPLPPAKPSPARLAVSPQVAAICDQRQPATKRLRLLMEGNIELGTDPRDLHAVLTVLADPAEGDALRNELINLALRQHDTTAAEQTLAAIAASPAEQPRFRSFAVQGLGRLEQQARAAGDAARVDALRARLHGFADHAEELSRREALCALALAGDAPAIARLRAHLDRDPTDGLTDVAIRCVREQSDRSALPRLRQLAAKDRPDVQVAAIEALGHLGDAESRVLLADLAQRATGLVREAAQHAHDRLAATAAAANTTPPANSEAAP